MSKYWMIKAHPAFRNFVDHYKNQFSELGYNLNTKEITKITFNLLRYSDLHKIPKERVKKLADLAKRRGMI